MTGALLVLAGWLAVLHWGQPPRDTLYWNTLFDAGHAVGFAVSTWALDRGLQRWRPRLPPGTRAGVAMLLGGLLAGLTELAQFADPRREPSLGDVLRDMAGVTSYLALRYGRANAHQRTSVRLARAATLVALVAFAFGPWVRVTSAYRQRDAAFPVVVGFEPGWQDVFLTTNEASVSPIQSSAPAGTPEPTARLLLEPARYPGFSVDEVFPDWRGFDRLVMSVQLEGGSPLDLVLRVHDSRHSGEEHDRFNRRLRLHPGWQRIVIPLEDMAEAPAHRRLELSEVRGLSIFAPALNVRAEVRLTALRLE